MHKRLIYAACMLAMATGAKAIEAPAVLNQTGYDGSSLTLSWSPVEGATGYRVSVWSLGETTSESKDVNLVVSKDQTSAYTPAVNGHLDEAVMYFSVSGVEGLNEYETLTLVFNQCDKYLRESSILSGSIFVGSMKVTDHVSTFAVFGGYPVDEFTSCIRIDAGWPGSEPQEPGVLTINRVVNTYRPFVYLMEDKAVGADVNQLTVSGLDPAKNYYAAVSSVQGDEASLPSETLRLDGMVPTVLTGATEFSENSYTANWLPNPKASSYVVTNYEVLRAEGSCPLSETGAGCKEGTFDEPLTVESFDPYTATPGWLGASCLIADGMFGVPDGQRRGGRPIGGYLYSPAVDLSAYEGKMSVSLELQGDPGDVINVYAGTFDASRVHPVTVPESGLVAESFELTGGTADCQVRLESTTLKKFFLRKFTVAQGEARQNVLLEDNFDKADQGTFESPIERISPDDYTSMSGWTVNSPIIAEGMFGTFGGMLIGGRPYGGGTMTTPPLGFADGNATVSFRLQSSAPEADEITVYIGDYSEATATVIPVPADGIIEKTLVLPNASERATVHFDSKNLKKFMLDNIKVCQEIAPGQYGLRKLSSETVTEGTSHTFTGLSPETEYAYSLRTDRLNFFGGAEEGKESEIHLVGSYAGVESVAVDSENLSPVVAEIFTDLTGRRVAQPAAGTIVIRTAVRADGSATSSKLIVR